MQKKLKPKWVRFMSLLELLLNIGCRDCVIRETTVIRPGLQIRHFEKTQEQKTHNSRKKLNNSAEKLKSLTKFTEKKKKLKYFCCKNTFYQKSICSIFIPNKNYAAFNKLKFFDNKSKWIKFPALWQNSRKKLKGSTSLETQVVENRSNL